MSQNDPQSTEASPPPPPPPSLPSAPPTNKDENMWAMLAHLAGLVGFVIPYCGFVGPLVVWLIQKDKMPFVDDQAKESLNFQLTILIALMVATVLTILLCIAFPLLIVIGIFDVVMIILAAVKVNSGEAYRYPVCLRLIK